ncbi:MAG: hypothetical protein COB23_09235 [Methylophaga sp.]|nr:MAG: hypothetical protein COB23_09235 [Methylophaga sp.]
MKDENSRAGFAHETVMINLSVFHLFLPVAALSSGYISVLLTLSLTGSTVMISWIVRKAYQQTATELVREHWKFA